MCAIVNKRPDLFSIFMTTLLLEFYGLMGKKLREVERL